MTPPLAQLDNDLPLGSPLFEIRKRLLRLFERNYLIDHKPDAPRVEKLADFGELPALGVHEQERMRISFGFGTGRVVSTNAI